MTPTNVAAMARDAILGAALELDELDDIRARDPEAERADPRLIDLAREIGHARTHLALAARKAAEIMNAPAKAHDGGEP